MIVAVAGRFATVMTRRDDAHLRERRIPFVIVRVQAERGEKLAQAGRGYQKEAQEDDAADAKEDHYEKGWPLAAACQGTDRVRAGS